MVTAQQATCRPRGTAQANYFGIDLHRIGQTRNRLALILQDHHCRVAPPRTLPNS